LIHKFDSDFYDEELKLCIIGYLRTDKSYNSLEELKDAIANDVSMGSSKLDEEENLKFKSHEFFQ
jgi:riboflavin kinase